jgi:hypothetical protein
MSMTFLRRGVIRYLLDKLLPVGYFVGGEYLNPSLLR